VPHLRPGALVAAAVCLVLLGGCAGQPSASLTAVPSAPLVKSSEPNVFGALRTTGTTSVALTFDDGPDPRDTARVLDQLRRHGVKATFCLVGSRARKYPALVKRIAAEGHTLCNHSWRHRRDLGQQSETAMLADLRKTNEAIALGAPGAKIAYFRAPYGAFSRPLVDVARRMGMTSIYWSVDTKDWDVNRYGRGPSMVRHIVYAIRHHTRPGAIILAHDLRKPDTVAALAQVLPWLTANFTIAAMPVQSI
jgi:peptidoglycan/xylan/chitin deacetylase (PgdA/CDA1 family)